MIGMVNEELHVPEWTFGERLAKARKDAGLTQEAMAELLRISHSAVAKWEADRGQPRGLLDRIGQWAYITNVPVGWLLGIMEPKSEAAHPSLHVLLRQVSGLRSA